MVTPSKFLAPPGVSVNSRSNWIVQEFSGSTTTSTNFDILARFQQKQLQEKEQKLIQLYDQQQQRAHQVALRGSAGSNDSNESSHESVVSNPVGKVRQMFVERRYNATRGIDKSYPLDPLDVRMRKQAVGNRRSLGTKRATRIDAGVGSQQRNNISRDFCIERSNGQAINIDAMIDTETMKRNRKLSELEGRSQLEVVGGEFPGDVTDTLSEKTASRKTSQLERLKNPSLRKINAIAPLKKPTIPVGSNVRQSTLMKMTKSASLKIRKLSRNRKTVEDKKTRMYASNQAKKKTKKQNICTKVEYCQRGNNLSTNLSALKSTPLVYEIIRDQHKNIRSEDTNLLGKVKSIVMKMENLANMIKNKTNASSKSTNNAESTKTSLTETKKENESSEPLLSPATKRPSIIDFDECKINSEELVKVFSDKSKEAPVKKTEGKDEGGGLISQRESNSSAVRGQRESPVEHSTDHRKITIIHQIDKSDEREDRHRDNPRGSSGGCANRARRASFETKRMIFERPKILEQFHPRRDSVESALRHFDSIEVGSTDTSKERTRVAKGKGRDRIRAKETLDKNAESKGFEKHTSSWLMKIIKKKASKNPRSATSGRKISPKRKISAGGKSNASAKLSEARDSIELTRISVKVRSPIFRMIACDSKPDDSLGGSRADGNQRPVVKIQSFLSSEINNRAIRQKIITSNERVPKIETFPFSTIKNPIAESNSKKADPRVTELKTKKNPNALVSSKSSEDAFEQQKNQSPVKSTSMKFLNRIVDETNGDNGLPRKSSVSGIDELDSAPAPLKDEKPAVMPQAPRTSPSLAPNAGIGVNRNQGASSNRSFNKGKTAVSSPLQKLSPAAKNSASSDEALVRCKVCNRRFSTERITRHEDICSKTAQKKRKQFDPVTQRVKGTELESFVKKPLSKKQGKSSRSDVEPDLNRSNWRRKHEDFINAIRSAKQMQVHLAEGGKLSDLPPPPPSDTSDYVQCPHCSRRFSQGAASRHIPKCGSMQHNKRSPVNLSKSRR